MRNLYFEIIEYPPSIRVLRTREPSATFFHGTTADMLPSTSALEVLGTLSRFDVMSHGFVTVWNTDFHWRQMIAKQLDQLTDEQHKQIAELASVKQAGFDTKFLQDLNEVE